MTETIKKNIPEEERIHIARKALPDRKTLIAELAYYKAEKRGFKPGHELDDWLEAERECTQL